MNVTAANENNRADWNLTVDYVRDYDLQDYVTPNEMHALADRIKVNTTLAELYQWDESRKHGELADNKMKAKDIKDLGCRLATSEAYER